jgi:hypothetical protein
LAWSIALATVFGSPYHRRPNWQRIGNQIEAAPVLARANFVHVRVKRAVRLRQRHSVIVRGKRISCPPHYVPPNNDYDPPHHDYEHGFPLIRSLRASMQRSTSVLFSFSAFLVDCGRISHCLPIKNVVTFSLLRGEQKRQNPPREVLANHHRNSPQRWMELRLYLKYGSQGSTILGCGRRAQRRWTLYCACRSRVACLSRTRIRNSNRPT